MVQVLEKGQEWISKNGFDWEKEIDDRLKKFQENDNSFPEEEISAGDVLTDVMGYVFIILMFIGVYFFYLK